MAFAGHMHLHQGGKLLIAESSELTSRVIPRRCRRWKVYSAVAAPLELKHSAKPVEGHSALLQGLGEMGEVATKHVPWLLRLAHIRYKGVSKGDGPLPRIAAL